MSLSYFGATSVGIKAKNGVVLASEKRLAYGGYIMSRGAKKVYKVTDRIGVAFAGLFADLQALTRFLRAEVKFYEVTSNRVMTVKSAAKLLSNILYSQKFIPFLSEAIVGGIDPDGPHVYVLDPIGSLIEDDYAALGSGASIAIGVLESGYTSDITLENAEKLAVSSIEAAIKRDAASGDGVDLIIISEGGIVEKEVKVKR